MMKYIATVHLGKPAVAVDFGRLIHVVVYLAASHDIARAAALALNEYMQIVHDTYNLISTGSEVK